MHLGFSSLAQLLLFEHLPLELRVPDALVFLFVACALVPFCPCALLLLPNLRLVNIRTKGLEAR